jgi:hypothetical protein
LSIARLRAQPYGARELTRLFDSFGHRGCAWDTLSGPLVGSRAGRSNGVLGTRSLRTAYPHGAWWIDASRATAPVSLILALQSAATFGRHSDFYWHMVDTLPPFDLRAGRSAAGFVYLGITPRGVRAGVQISRRPKSRRPKAASQKFGVQKRRPKCGVQNAASKKSASKSRRPKCGVQKGVQKVGVQKAASKK